MTNELANTIYGEELYRFDIPVVVAINKPWMTLSADDKALLTKILGAIRQSINSVKVIHEAAIDAAALNPGTRLISFGAPISPPISPYQLTSVNGASIVFSDSLDALDDAKKKSLWSAIKQL